MLACVENAEKSWDLRCSCVGLFWSTLLHFCYKRLKAGQSPFQTRPNAAKAILEGKKAFGLSPEGRGGNL
jgi:hypothetical protein